MLAPVDRVARVRLMVVPAVARQAVVRCIQRVRSPADLRPDRADVLALASVLVSVALVPDLAVLAPVVVA